MACSLYSLVAWIVVSGFSLDVRTCMILSQYEEELCFVAINGFVWSFDGFVVLFYISLFGIQNVAF